MQTNKDKRSPKSYFLSKHIYVYFHIFLFYMIELHYASCEILFKYKSIKINVTVVKLNSKLKRPFKL